MGKSTNADRFLNAFAAIEREMKIMLNLKDHRPFFELVNKSSKINPLINRHRFDLKEYSELRNAIVHDRSGGEIIAEPNDDTVTKIEKIAGLLLEPPKVTPLFAGDVLILSAGDPVSKAIRELSRHAYTQAPVLEKGTLAGLLTLKILVKWMGSRLAENDLDIENTTVKDLLDQAGNTDGYEIVNKDRSLVEIPELFYRWQNEGSKLEAVLITERGDPSEKILGIITNRDLPLVHRTLA